MIARVTAFGLDCRYARLANPRTGIGGQAITARAHTRSVEHKPVDGDIGPYHGADAFWMVTREQELWGLALWVEKHHGENGWFYIAQQQDRFLANGELGGVTLWRKVGKRFNALQDARRNEAGCA